MTAGPPEHGGDQSDNSRSFRLYNRIKLWGALTLLTAMALIALVRWLGGTPLGWGI